MVVVAQGREPTRTAAETARACAVADWNRGLLVIPVRKTESKDVPSSDTGIPIELSTSSTVGDFVDKWLNSQRSSVRDTTYEQYESRLRVHVPQQLRQMALVDVKRLHILNLEASLVEKLSASTRKKVVDHLASVFQMAIDAEIIVRNPALNIKVTKSVEEQAKPKRRKALTDDELHTFLRVAESDVLYPVFYTMFSLGLRCGEALGLRWQDFDAREQVVEVAQGVRLYRNKPLVGPLKSDCSYRSLPIGADLVEVLERHRLWQDALKAQWGSEWPSTGLIFTTMRGTVLDRHNVYRTMHRLCDQAGLSRFGTHSGRHTNLTNRCRDGQPIEVVAKYAGHSKPSVTQNIYRHVAQDEMRRATYDLSAHLRRSAENVN